MKALMLVGGKGTRLRPLTFSTPKPLLPLCGVPHLKLQIAWLKKYGVTEITLSLGYLPTQFIDCFESGEYLGVKINYVVEDELLGTAGAIKYASDSLELGQNEDFLICNGDILTEFKIDELIKIHKENNALASIGLTEVEDPSKFGVVPTKETGEITAFVEKPKRESAPTNWINAGIYIFNPEMLDFIPEGIQSSIERDIFPFILETRGQMFAVHSKNYWMDIGTPEQYIQANNRILDELDNFEFRDIVLEGKTEILPNVWSSDAVVPKNGLADNLSVSGKVILGADVQIESGVQLSNVCLGDSVSIGQNSNLNSAFIGDGSSVSHDVKIVDSAVGSNTHLGHDCVIDENTLVGSDVMVDPNITPCAERVQ